jgi:hypothetical protein
MFQSLEYTKELGYDEKANIYSYEYKLTDSDFGCVRVVLDANVVVFGVEVAVGAVIQEYRKRNLNVAYNLLLYFQWYEKNGGWSIAEQIERAEKYQPLFTPKVKTELDKYLLLL